MHTKVTNSVWVFPQKFKIVRGVVRYVHLSYIGVYVYGTCIEMVTFSFYTVHHCSTYIRNAIPTEIQGTKISL
jgi:hypothetical protein